jgi:hypothetical protein
MTAPNSYGLPDRRTCQDCHTSHELTAEFYVIDKRRYPWNHSYFQAWCRVCGSARAIAWKIANRDSRNARRRATYAVQKANKKNMAHYPAAARELEAEQAKQRRRSAVLKAQVKKLMPRVGGAEAMRRHLGLAPKTLVTQGPKEPPEDTRADPINFEEMLAAIRHRHQAT